MVRTTLSLSAARATSGREQAPRISVAVSAGIGLRFGTVLVDAAATAVHPIRLGSGAGSYTLVSRQLRPGTSRGSRHYADRRLRSAMTMALACAASAAALAAAGQRLGPGLAGRIATGILS